MPKEAPLKQFSLRMSVDLYEQIEQLSNLTRISKTALIRLALEKLLHHMNNSDVQRTLKEILK